MGAGSTPRGISASTQRDRRIAFSPGDRISSGHVTLPRNPRKMRLTRYFLPVLKETPAEAQIVSHRLMLRAGMILSLIHI